MKILCIQHVPFEGPAAIVDWVARRGHTLQCTLASDLFAEGTPAPDFDALILMGGPMSANDTDTLPWLSAETEFVRRQLSKGGKVVGICLGAQILARALGGAVFRNTTTEIGWFPVTVVATHSVLDLAVDTKLRLFHWHGETFSIPPGATHLLRSALCENQAFIWQDQALGLQCHPEITAEGIAALSAASRDELRKCGIPEDGASLQGIASDFAEAQTLLFQMLDGLFPDEQNVTATAG